MPDICIIGGGASAMAAAVTAARLSPSLEICILEKKDLLGKKLAATGNGKCNMTNALCSNVKETLNFFASIGIMTRTDEQDRIYPYSMQARDVVHGLTRQLDALKVEVKTDCPVENVEKAPEGFKITCKAGTLSAKKVLLATGGKAGPQFGTAGDGYRFAKSLGHQITKLAPILTGLETAEAYKQLKGLRVKGTVSLYKNETLTAKERGEVQFTEDGVSGICVFNLSRFIKFAAGERFTEGIGRYAVELDFLPDMNREQVRPFLWQRCQLEGLEAGDLLLSIVPQRLADVLLGQSGIGSAKDFTEANIGRLADLLKGWKLPLSGMKGWKMAQCTAGGVDLREIDLVTMESRIVKNLYFSGEIIDFDGPCGGFNLQNAWETGIKAGMAIAAGEHSERA